MKEKGKTKVQLMQEMAEMSRRIAELETSETRRVEAETALRTSEELYRTLIETSPDAIIMYSLRGELLAANAQAAKVFGVSSVDELLQEVKTIYELLTEEGRAFAAANFHRTLSEGYSQKNEYLVRLKNGTFIPMEINSSIIRTATGEPQAFISVVRDITDRKTAEKALRESEEKFRKIFEDATEGFYRTTINGICLNANPALARMFGFTSPGEMIEYATDIGKQLYVNARDRKRLFSMLQEHGSVKGFEIEVYHKDGSQFWISLNARAVRDGEGHIQYVEGTMIDISDRKRAEELYRTVAESTHSGVYIVQDGKMQFVNPYTTEYSGFPKEELLGQNPLDYVHPEDREMVRSNAINMLKGVMSAPYEYRVIDCQGRIKWLMETVRSITYEGKRAVLGNTMNITDRHYTEQILRQAQKMEALGTMAGGIAHDFNNILGAMIGYTEMAKGEQNLGKLQYYLDHVLKACDRAKGLVAQILTFSRQREQERKPVLLGPIIKEAVKLLRASLPTTIQIHQQITPALAMVYADPTQIHQVLMNLCTNAAHAMREKGGVLEIQLSLEKSDPVKMINHPDLSAENCARLTVKDTGHGIDQTIITRIFDPFFTTKASGEGTGLGLSVVYGIVKNHGGAIDVVSNPGQGTIFTIYLPLIETAEHAPEHDKGTLQGGTERILFVDDEPELVQVAREILVLLGYRVTVRTSSIEALEAFRVRPRDFDLVITDMTMPNMTGLTLAQEVLRIRPDIPVILCTGFSEMISEEKAKTLGIRRFMMKPLFKHELAKGIREVLENQ